MDHNDDKFEEMKLDNDPSSKPSDHVSYPKINPIEAPVPPPLNKQTSDPSPMGSQSNSDHPKSKSASSTPKSVRWSAELTQEAPASTTMPSESNHYVSAASPTTGESKTSSSVKSKVDLAKEVLGRWGKKVGETTKKAEGIAGNVWQHLKTGPSVADAAMGRIAHGTKVLAEGGYEKIFRQTFETIPEEQFQRSYACYLSTSAGPVMGTLYLSTEKLAFCSDNPLSYTVGDKAEWSYYKVPLVSGASHIGLSGMYNGQPVSTSFGADRVAYRELSKSSAATIAGLHDQLRMVTQHNERFLCELEHITAKRDVAVAERNVLAAERDAAVVERDAARAKADASLVLLRQAGLDLDLL